MAVEVVKKPPAERARVFGCKKCKATLKATKNDGRYVSDQRDGDAVIITCPLCKAENWLDVSLFKRD